MRNFTRIALVILISMVSLQSYAQTFGVKAGVNFANQSINFYDDTDIILGYHIGGSIDIHLYKFLSIETGALLSTKGHKTDVFVRENSYDPEKTVTFKTKLYYIDIPVSAKFKCKVSKSVYLYGLVGEYISIGLSGKAIIEDEVIENAVGELTDDYFGENIYKRIDYGLTFGGGVEIKKIQLGLSYDLGLGNISSYTEDGTSVKNRVLKLSVGYRF